jgi:hypothetical protein
MKDYSLEIIFIWTGVLVDNYGTLNPVYHFAIQTAYSGIEKTLYVTK